MTRAIERISRLEGVIKVPGDKSISHRALILGAMARGHQVIEGLSEAVDVATTADALRAMGCFVEVMPDGRTMVLPKVLRSEFSIDAGNSGTTARILAGVAAARATRCEITGDASLCRRPMLRVAEPLERMGARITLTNGGTLPAVVEGGALHGIEYETPLASAQVKSAILLAGLSADGTTTVIESTPSRDHTEIMLRAMGAALRRDGNRISVDGGTPIEGITLTVPGDFSSAAFFMVAALLVPGSQVMLPFTGINPRRIALMTVLQKMGGRVTIEGLHAGQLEPAGDIAVASSELQAIEIDDPATVASMIDEIPILAVAATQAQGRTVIHGAGELRHKESDRIEAMTTNLRALGATVEAFEDGFAIQGPTPLRGATVSSFGDHRVAMAMAVAGLIAEGTTHIENDEIVSISYPRFFMDLRALAR
ncbi:MAG TPA: 3-phosphoshikimate 1-carboxyvinyltransferase [Candidatus Krumholzibacteria bacterium]|nr:3-phosphoshikimate 1-carboxyvinyltransferase [Candidatus Krumholzibacteria bacterium]